MKIEDVVWAKGEFAKLCGGKPDLMLSTSHSELVELLKEMDLMRELTHIPPMILGMKLEIIPAGWYVRDQAGNQIGRTSRDLDRDPASVKEIKLK